MTSSRKRFSEVRRSEMISGVKPGKTLQLRIRIAAEVGDRLIDYAYRQPSVKERKVVLDELKEMLAKYLLRL